MLGLLIMMGSLFLSGCGDPNSQSASVNADKGTHVAGWLPAGHMTKANENSAACAECHGADFSGGMSKVACTKCHLGDETKMHPLDWVDIPATLTKHKQYVAANGDSSCRNQWCHGVSLQGVANSGPSCNACHSYP